MIRCVLGAVTFGRRAIFLALLAPQLQAAGDAVQIRLTQGGQDVTFEHPEAIVHLSRPHAAGGNPVKCAVGGPLCLVPPGTYSAAVEDPHLLSETRVSMTVEQIELIPISLSLPVVQSATVEMDPGSLPAGSFLSAVDEKSGMLYTRDLVGPIPLIRVPARATILCAFQGEERAIGCLRVFGKPGEVIRLSGTPRLGRGRGQAYLGFAYAPDPGVHDAVVSLQVGGKIRTPDAVTGLGSRMWALWLDLPAGRAAIRIESPTWRISSPADVDVPDRGTLVRMRIPLAKKPSLVVRFTGADALGDGPMDVELMNCARAVAQFEGGSPPPLLHCRSSFRDSGPHGIPFRYSALAADLYAVHWKKVPFEGAAWADLRSGTSREIEIPIKLLDVSGRVTKKGHGAPSTMKWEAVNEGGVLRSRSDEDGRYSLRLSHPGTWGVTINADDGTEWGGDVLAGEKQRFDFDLPANRVRVNVITRTGEPVPGARITYEVKTPADVRVEFGTRKTNAAGEATLPALPAGLLSTRVFADGFRPASGDRLEITDRTADADVRVTLLEGAGILIRIVSSGGEPAAQAMVWSGNVGTRADADGVATIEEKLPADAPLVAFDQKGSMGFFRFSGADEQTIRIPPSGPPILLRFRTSDGRPLGGQNVIVGMDGVVDNRRLLNQALWSGGDAHSQADGSFRLTGIPREGILTLAPWGHPELGIVVAAPVTEDVVFVLPVPPS